MLQNFNELPEHRHALNSSLFELSSFVYVINVLKIYIFSNFNIAYY